MMSYFNLNRMSILTPTAEVMLCCKKISAFAFTDRLVNSAQFPFSVERMAFKVIYRQALYKTYGHYKFPQGDVFLDIFDNKPNLISLNLAQYRLGDHLINVLSTALIRNSTITKLDLRMNNIFDEGAQRLATMLEQNSSITYLDLRYNKIELPGAEDLGDALSKNTTLTILDLRNNSGEISNIRNRIKKILMKRQTQLLTNQPSRSDSQLSSSSKLLPIKHQLLNSNLSSDLQATLLDVFNNTPNLTVLNLRLNGIGTTGAKLLAYALQNNSTLTSLNLRLTRIGATCAKDLASGLKSNSSIISLDLSSNQINDNGIQALATLLHHNSSITSLNLSSNIIHNRGAIALANAIQQCVSIESLDLSWNYIQLEGAQALGACLQHHSMFTTLNLQNNKIGSDGADSIANALKHDPNITIKLPAHPSTHTLSIPSPTHYTPGLILKIKLEAYLDHLIADKLPYLPHKKQRPSSD